MNDITWIKITTDIFDDEKVQLIEELPEGDSILLIWFKLLTLAGKKNACGLIYLTKDIPYTVEMLSKLFRKKINIINLSLATFKKFYMVEIKNDIIKILNWEKHQNVEGMEKIREQAKIRQSRYRNKQKLLESNVTSRHPKRNNNVSVTDNNGTEKNRIREEQNKKRKKSKTPSPKITKSLNEIVKTEYGELNNILLTELEYEKLTSDYGLKIATKYINSLSLYDKMKKYKNHNLTIRSWINKDDIPKLSDKNSNSTETKLRNNGKSMTNDEWVKREVDNFENNFKKNTDDYIHMFNTDKEFKKGISHFKKTREPILGITKIDYDEFQENIEDKLIITKNNKYTISDDLETYKNNARKRVIEKAKNNKK